MALTRPINAIESQLAGKRVLVTGAGGFIGSHLAERLLAAGCRVRAMVKYNSRNSFGYLDDVQHPLLEIVSGDCCDGNFCNKTVEDCEIVFHLAALIAIPYSYVAPGSYVNNNIVGTLNLLQASMARGVQRFIQTSTSEVYGSAQYVPMDEKHPLHPQSPYAATKVGSDQLASSFHLSFGLPVTVVRPFNTYGPRQSMRAVLPTICQQALHQDSVQLGNADSERDLTYVDDTCAGFLHAALASEAVGRTINLGYGDTYSVRFLVETVAEILGKKLDIVLDEQRLRPTASEVTRLWSDNRLAKELLKWEPSIPIRAGLESVLHWLRETRSGSASSYAL